MSMPTFDEWEEGETTGARAAHDDATKPADQRLTFEQQQEGGPAFFTGYNAHLSDLRGAGLVNPG